MRAVAIVIVGLLVAPVATRGRAAAVITIVLPLMRVDDASPHVRLVQKRRAPSGPSSLILIVIRPRMAHPLIGAAPLLIRRMRVALDIVLIVAPVPIGRRLVYVELAREAPPIVTSACPITVVIAVRAVSSTIAIPRRRRLVPRRADGIAILTNRAALDLRDGRAAGGLDLPRVRMVHEAAHPAAAVLCV